MRPLKGIGGLVARLEKDKATSWGQRVQILQQPLHVKKGEKIPVKLKDNEGRLVFFEVMQKSE